jgi:hypothetical protein
VAPPFAPAERATAKELEAARDALARQHHLAVLLDAIPDWALALNKHRQIIGAGKTALDLLGIKSADGVLGARPGEAVSCVHSDECSGGCGTAPACSQCGAVNAVLECLRKHETVERECRIATRGSCDGGALDLRARATYVEVEGEPVVVLALRDISADKRRAVLERVFLEGIYDAIITVHQLAQLIDDETDEATPTTPFTARLRNAAHTIMDELEAYRVLRSAENGTLPVRSQEVYLPDLIEGLARAYSAHPEGAGKAIVVADITHALVSVDVPLALRALGNVLLNALEATPKGGRVSLASTQVEDNVVITVHNDAVMPPEVQLQVFQRSFTTKGTGARGIGTYCSRLYIERYLGGAIDFESGEPTGTTFRVTFPAASLGAA